MFLTNTSYNNYYCTINIILIINTITIKHMKKQANTLTTEQAYKILDNAKKATVRDSFLKYFDYSLDTFYKKIRGTTPLKPIEKKWLCKKLKVSEN